MKFYKAEGRVKCSQTEKDDFDICTCAKGIYLKSDMFNQSIKDRAYYFVSAYSSDGIKIRIGVLSCDSHNITEKLYDYLREIEVELSDLTVNETTFEDFCRMLRCSDRNSFICDDDEILEQFGLDRLINGRGRTLEYAESLLDGNVNMKEVYSSAGAVMMHDSFVPELDRIYMGKSFSKANGHPVHYIIGTDDCDIRCEAGTALLEALYANGRIKNRRYCIAHFSAGDSFSGGAYDALYRSCFDGAIVVIYTPSDDVESECASGERETIRRLCRNILKYRNDVLTVLCFPRECSHTKNIFFENLGGLSLIELSEEPAKTENAEAFLRNLARESGIRSDKKLVSRLQPDKGYLASELRDMFDEWYGSKLKTSVYPQYKETITARREAVIKEKKGTAFDELQAMIGLTEAKKTIGKALDYYKVQRLFMKNGMTEDRPAMHMVFTGNPGTAKTTAARLFAGIMRENGLLSEGQLVEVGRSDLVGKYVGWTAKTIKQKFEDAKGGVLFIDEAYSLVDGHSGSYGDEAINTIVQEMENNRDSTVVIFAGYPDKMEEFLSRNPGLRSRIAFHVRFDDYTADELCGIARLMGDKKKITFTDDAMLKMREAFETARCQDDFGNGRFVRNFVEQARMNQASRILKLDPDSVTDRELSTLCADDIEIPYAASEKNIRRIGFAC